MTLLPLALIMLAGVMSPGPASAAILALGFAGRPRDGVLCAAGVTAINLCYALAVLTGLAVLTEIDPGIRALAMAGGGALLVWIGWRIWRGGRAAARQGTRMGGAASAAVDPDASDDVPPASPPPRPRRAGSLGAFLLGVAVQASNLNAMVFFASVFAATAPAGAGIGTKAGILALVAAISFGWYGTLGAVSGRLAQRCTGGSVTTARLRQAAGLAVIAFGAWIVWRAASEL